MSDKSQDMLCQALELAENAKTFYAQTLSSCSDSMGKEIFTKLQEDKEAHISRIKEVHAGLVKGDSWADSCTLGLDANQNTKAVIQELAARYPEGTCPASELEAVKTAIELEQKLQGFYQTNISNAHDAVEKEFLEKMSNEARMHIMLLKDTEYYFDDPEGWHGEHEHSGLDGA